MFIAAGNGIRRVERFYMKRNETIQIFRGILCLYIVFGHALDGLRAFNPFGFLQVSVTPFFVMSGFLLALNSKPDNEPLNLKSCFASMKKRIARLYPLHVATAVFIFLLWAVRYWHGGIFWEQISDLSINLFLNILLLQSWFPKNAISLNSPAWYLSTAAFLYFAFPLIKKINYKFDRGALLFAIILLLRFFYVAAVLSVDFATNSELYSKWACYHFPLFRLTDFWIACLAGAFYMKNKDKLRLSNFASALGQLVAAVFGVAFFSIKLDAFPFWIRVFFKSDIVRLLLSVLWVYFFFEGKGFLRFLNVVPLVALGNISGFCYLIHCPVMEFQNAITAFLNVDLTKFNSLQLYAVFFAEFYATIALSLLWAFLGKRLASLSPRHAPA